MIEPEHKKLSIRKQARQGLDEFMAAERSR